MPGGGSLVTGPAFPKHPHPGWGLLEAAFRFHQPWRYLHPTHLQAASACSCGHSSLHTHTPVISFQSAPRDFFLESWLHLLPLGLVRHPVLQGQDPAWSLPNTHSPVSSQRNSRCLNMLAAGCMEHPIHDAAREFPEHPKMQQHELGGGSFCTAGHSQASPPAAPPCASVTLMTKCL